MASAIAPANVVNLIRLFMSLPRVFMVATRLSVQAAFRRMLDQIILQYSAIAPPIL
jgi:hypothetical protein